MNAVSEKSFTRITLALDIVKKIASGPFQGYHELSIIKHRIGLFDTITIEDAPSTRIVCADPRVPCDNNNICFRALDAIRESHGIDKNVRIVIEKNIPVMGGLAGGSANAATTLRLLNKLWMLGMDEKRMMEIGRTLGMDVPYFFSGNTAFDSEAGGILEPIPTSCRFNFLLVVPDFGVSTKEAYANVDYAVIGKNLSATASMRDALIKNDADAVLRDMHNDFELSVFTRYPKLARIKRRLMGLGCRNAIMTGSGSTMMGIVDDNADTELFEKRIGHKTIAVKSM